jgi:hypothetical protein
MLRLMLESIRDKMVNSLSINRLFGIIRREVVSMTTYEIIMIFLGIVALLISFGGLLIAILTYLNKRK